MLRLCRLVTGALELLHSYAVASRIFSVTFVTHLGRYWVAALDLPP